MHNEPILTDEMELPRRPASPLPWLLLGITVAVAIGIFGMGRARLNDERLRTANALKANDEVVARLRTASSEVLSRQMTVEALEAKRKELERQVAELEAKNTALGLEVEALKPKRGRR